MVGAAATIRSRREALGLTRKQVADEIGLGDYDYTDIELFDDELYTVIPLGLARKLCSLLGIDMFDLFAISCDAEETRTDRRWRGMARNTMIAATRTDAAQSPREFSDRIGFDESEVAALENDPDRLDKWLTSLVVELAHELRLPVHWLLGLQCGGCV